MSIKVLRIMVVALGLAMLFLSWAAADEQAAAGKNTNQDTQAVEPVGNNLDELKAGIDRWHVANLKGDPSEIERLQSKLFEIIRTDIKQSNLLMQKCEEQTVQAAGGFRGNDSSVPDGSLRIGEADLKAARQMVMAKEKLLAALKRTHTFSNKYRLLNDYVELLQREQGVVRTEIAEDVSGLHQGK